MPVYPIGCDTPWCLFFCFRNATLCTSSSDQADACLSQWINLPRKQESTEGSQVAELAFVCVASAPCEVHRNAIMVAAPLCVKLSFALMWCGGVASLGVLSDEMAFLNFIPNLLLHTMLLKLHVMIRHLHSASKIHAEVVYSVWFNTWKDSVNKQWQSTATLCRNTRDQFHLWAERRCLNVGDIAALM